MISEKENHLKTEETDCHRSVEVCSGIITFAITVKMKTKLNKDSGYSGAI